MTANTDARNEQMEAAAKSVAAKLQSFQDGLTADEHTVLGLAMSAVVAAQPGEDVAGFADDDPIGPVRDWCLTWQFPWGINGWPLPPTPPRFA